MKNIISSQWQSNPAWQSMDMTAKGFHTQLVLIACENKGKIPYDDHLWRQWLHIPQAEQGQTPISQGFPAVLIPWIKEGAPGRLEALGGAEMLTEYYWSNRWLPMILSAWYEIEPGLLTCEQVQLLLKQSYLETEEKEDSPTSTKKTKNIIKKEPQVKKTKNKQKIQIQSYRIEDLVSPVYGVQKHAKPFLIPLNLKILSSEDVLAKWHNPIKRKERLDLWSMGEQLLNSAGSNSQSNRSFIASMIKQFGENQVLVALNNMAKRNTIPADPRALLRGILMKQNKTSLNIQHARNQRTNTAL